VDLLFKRGSHEQRPSAEHLAVAQHDTSVTLGADHAQLVEIFKNLNCRIAPDSWSGALGAPTRWARPYAIHDEMMRRP